MNVLITGSYNYTQEQIAQIEKLGYSVTVHADELAPCPTPELYGAVVGNALFLHNDISEFKDLKFVQLTSVGLERIPLEKIAELGIKLSNAQGIYSIPIAEWITLKILEIYKRTRHFVEAQQTATWAKNYDLLELNGKTVGLIGVGSIGREVAKRLEAFGAYVIGFDVRDPKCSQLAEYCAMSDLRDNIGRCDIVILTVPLFPETYHLINADIIRCLKDNCVLVNVSRGQIIDEAQLIANLDKFRGVALDVFEEEPLPANSPLWNHEKVIVTPHNSFASDNTSARMFDLILENLRRLMAGEEPIAVVKC